MDILRRHKQLRDGLHIAQRSADAEPRAIDIDNPPPMDVLEQITGLPALEADRVLVVRSTTSSTDSSSSCSAGDHSAACEKPISGSTFTLPIILGVTIPLFGSIILFFYLHRRHVRKQREEDLNDRTNTMDFGLDHVPGLPGKRKFEEPLDENDSREKGRSGRPRQMSLDLDAVSPYLLPAELQSSRESLHSLSRTIHQNEDPYRPITHFLDDGKSIRSYARSKYDGSSIHTTSSDAPSRMQDLSKSQLLSNAAKMPRSNPPAPGLVPPPRYNSLPQSNRSSTATDSPIERKSPLDDEQKGFHARNPPTPALPVAPSGRSVSPSPRAPPPARTPSPASLAHASPHDSHQGDENFGNNYLGSLIEDGPAQMKVPPQSAGLQNGDRKAPPQPWSNPPNLPVPMPFAPGDNDYDDFHVTPPSPSASEELRGRRYSMDVPPEEFAKAGLGAPGFDANRLSMTLRPLPPSEVGETEDPEMRANRIRSFYKEYFDDTKPPPPGQYYYADASDDYYDVAEDMPYFDPDTNAFVMPYAEPVTRRAMTPPPRAQPHFHGPAGARPRMGSLGAMQNPGPRAASALSQARPGPRGPPKKFVPPQDLSTLPTPAKLRDDSFAILNANEFAPPSTYRDRVAGRSESPFGERRPYSPSVRSHTPLASAFEDLPAMPSPHLLRKSGTFTALDFAPPRRIGTDTLSDAGSIRSTRSGISAVQHNAVRSGAYRVSRLEPGMVGTRDDFANSLKPKWNAGR